MVNETETHTENASNWDHFDVEVRKSSKCFEKELVRFFLQNLDLYFNPKLKDNVNIGFSATACFFQILDYVL